ncbi:MAG: type II toxin-antitoxin system RelE/ParE family toxin [Elusimicrobiota bacterium]
MEYKIIFDERVLKNDFKAINQNLQQRIMTAIKTRLTVSPEQYGAPLHKTLKSFWKLRVGDYRVVFKIFKTEIHIFAIMHRKKVYLAALNRIK